LTHSEYAPATVFRPTVTLRVRWCAVLD